MQLDLESVIQSKVSQKEKNKYHVLKAVCGIQKDGTDEPNEGQKYRCRWREKTCDVGNGHLDTGGERWGGMNWEIRIDIYTLTMCKTDRQWEPTV